MGRLDVSALFGEVEADETYIGGKRPGKRGRGAAGKSVVVGIKQRQGRSRPRLSRMPSGAPSNPSCAGTCARGQSFTPMSGSPTGTLAAADSNTRRCIMGPNSGCAGAAIRTALKATGRS